MNDTASYASRCSLILYLDDTFGECADKSAHFDESVPTLRSRERRDVVRELVVRVAHQHEA